MFKHLRTKTRIRLKANISCVLCLLLAAPPVYGAGGTLSDPNANNNALLNAQIAGQTQERNDRIAREQREAREKANALRAQAQAKREEAKRVAEEAITNMNKALEALKPPPRRTMVGKLEPAQRGVVEPSPSPGTTPREPSSDDPTTPQPPPSTGPLPLPLPKPADPPVSTPAATPSSWLWNSVEKFVQLFTISEAYAGPLDLESLTNPQGPYKYGLNIERDIEQIGKRERFIGGLGVLSTKKNSQTGKPIWNSFEQELTTDGAPDTEAETNGDFMTQVKKYAGIHDVDPNATAEGVRLHFTEAIREENRRLFSEAARRANPSAAPVAEPITDLPHGADLKPGILADNEKNPDFGAENLALAGDNGLKDLNVTVEQVLPILAQAKSGLKQAQALMKEADALDQQANDAAANAPKGGGGNQGGQSPMAGGGGGGGGGDGGNKGNKGGGGSGGIVPGPGGIGDPSRAFAQPESPDLSSVAAASQRDPQDYPKWEGVNGGVTPPGILRSTQAMPATPTSGTPTVQKSNFIPGNMSPGSPIDRSMFAQNGGGGGEGGGGNPPMGGNPSGGVANLGGDNIGQGIGPSYGGRAGLNDPVKRYEVGPGGGSVSSESSGTVATGADVSIPAALMGQLATGRKIKDGPGRGGLGLMGQVSTLLQQQCADSTQRSKFEDFCLNANSVASRAKREDVQVAQTKKEDYGRGRAAGDRAPASSSK